MTEDKINWDETVGDIIAHFVTGEYGSVVELKNKALFISALIQVHEDYAKIEVYNVFNDRRARAPFFSKTINFADPDALDGSLTKEIDEVIHKLPVIVTENGIDVEVVSKDIRIVK